MKFKRAFRRALRSTIKFAQILPREKYIKYIKFIYGNSLVFDEQEYPRFIASDAYFDTTRPIFIGGGSTITSGVNILTHDYAVCYGATALDNSDTREFGFRKSVKIGRYSFIGQRTIILPGVVIGDNVIVGAGSVVTKNLDSGNVYAGNPAKLLCPISEYYKKKMDRDGEFIR